MPSLWIILAGDHMLVVDITSLERSNHLLFELIKVHRVLLEQLLLMLNGRELLGELLV